MSSARFFHSALYVSLLAIVSLPGCEPRPQDDWDGNILHGSIVDAEGEPVSGAIVTVDGVSSNEPTDAHGRYTVESPYEFGDMVTLTVYAPSFHGLEMTVPLPKNDDIREGLKGGGLEPIPLSSTGTPELVSITGPAEGENVELDACCNGMVTVRGIVSRPPRDNLYTDVVFVLDVSGSVADKGVFDAEIDAARSVVESLDEHTSRYGLISFATSAETRTTLTGDKEIILQALEALRADGPEVTGSEEAATHFAAALRSAFFVFKDSPISYVVSETGETVEIEPLKAVVFISDGIPTLPANSGLTQEKADINASLAQARHLAAQNIAVHGYALAVDKATRTLTTLPSIAAITGGSYFQVTDPGQAVFVVPSTSFVGIGAVEVQNTLTGESVTVEASPDGFYEAELGVVEGEQEIQVFASAWAGNSSASKTVTVVGVYEIDRDEAVGLAPSGVATNGLRTPSGQPLGDSDLEKLLIGSIGDYPDAVEAPAEVFVVPGNAGEKVTVVGELLLTEACYTSDVGYLIVDPTDLAKSTEKAFKKADSSNLLFNTSEGGPRCSFAYREPGTTQVRLTADAGDFVVFFIVADGSIREGQKKKKPVFYTVSSLNPGKFDQALTFFSAAGRRGVGGPHDIIAFEDISLASGSDSDYSDAVFFFSKALPSLPTCGCK